jgi:hypothetical protein
VCIVNPATNYYFCEVPTPNVTSVTIPGQNDLEVCQNETATLQIDGSYLDHASSVLVALLPCNIVSQSASQITCTISIPPNQGVPSSMDVQVDGVSTGYKLSPTYITVSSTGNDNVNPGTTSLPFASIRRAAGATGTGSTISVGPGTFTEGEIDLNSANLEGTVQGGITTKIMSTVQFPIETSGSTDVSNVSVEGASTTICSDGLTLVGPTTGTNVSIDNCATGVQIISPGATFDVTDVTITNFTTTGFDISPAATGALLKISGPSLISGLNSAYDCIQIPSGAVPTVSSGSGLTINGCTNAVDILGNVNQPTGSVAIDGAVMQGVSIGVLVNAGLQTLAFTNDTINTASVAIHDARTSSGSIISAGGSKLNNMTYPVGSSAQGPLNSSPQFQIDAVNTIQF